ncbi:Isobutyryl-CoA dehydrogenase [Diplonema papillatum]|nr:Isobutyryl-CoA dehydrogenase [Diplonema papillatum]
MMKAATRRSARLAQARFFSGGATFGLTEEQLLFQDAARSFAATEIEPHAAKWDATKHFPTDVLAKAGELGFGAVYVKDDHGTGAGRLDASVIFEQLSGACPSFTAFVTIHNMCCWMVDRFGTEEQRERILPDVCSMENLMSYCLTEPGSGSDAASLRTKAVKDGSNYVINGSKCFISGAGTAKYYVVMLRTGEGAKGISCIVVPKDTPGLSFGANESKMGWNCQPTRQVIFEDAVVPAENLLGGVEGKGFGMAMMGLDGGRINIATCSLGAAQRSLDLAVAYTKERQQFGKSISSFQNTQFKLADMAARVHASRLLVRQAAAAMDQEHPDKTAFCAMAKMKVTEDCWNVVDDALQLHGGYGYLQSYPIERFLRDLRVHRILEGTNEVMRLIVSRAVLA